MPNTNRSFNKVSEYNTIRSTIPRPLTSERIQVMDKEELILLQNHCGLGNTWGQILFPEKWMPLSQPKGQGNVYLRNRFKHVASEQEIGLALLTLTRMVLLCFCSPSKAGNRLQTYLSPSTILIRLVSDWIPMVKLALEQPVREDGKLLARLTKINSGSRRNEEIRRFNNYKSRSLWADVVTEHVSNSVIEKSNQGGFRPSSLRTEKSDPYLPLPDNFVLQVGSKAAWITQNLTPVLLDAFEATINFRKKLELTHSIHSRRISQFLENYNWHIPNEEHCNTPPFYLDKVSSLADKDWRPKRWTQLKELIQLSQMAHYFIVALSAGPRAGEILSFQTDCLTESRDGIPLANGKTFKLVEPVDGVLRSWPMPQLAILALVHQTRLSHLASAAATAQNRGALPDSPVAEPIWRALSQNRPGSQLRASYNKELRTFVSKLGMEHLLDSQAFTNHRFRKTIARLVALAHVHAPKILMDVFGHKSIAMTMHYITADKAIRAEMLEIRADLVTKMARKAINDSTINGGPAAKTILTAIQEIKFRQAGDFNAADEHELALMLTGQGRFWQYVRPGVICTKLSDQVGPCSKKQSRPNPARCSTSCSHRLEEAENRAEVHRVLKDIINKIEHGRTLNDFVLTEIWEGQLLTHLNRFDDVRKTWSNDPVVAQILFNRANELKNAN